MRCLSLKELLVLISFWKISLQMKDLLEEIQPSEDRPSQLNSFFEDVMKFKKAFKMIRNAAAANEEEDTMNRDRRDKDIDEYIYDEENYAANGKKSNLEEYSRSKNEMPPLQKPNRPLNDVYPHIYKEHADQGYLDKYPGSNLNFDKSFRYRRQLVENVQVEPKSTKGYIAAPGEKTSITSSKSNAEMTGNGANEALMTIFSQLAKVTLPAQEKGVLSTKTMQSVTNTPTLQTTPNGFRSFVLTTMRSMNRNDNLKTKEVKKSEEQSNEKNKRELTIDIIKNGKVIKEYSSEDNENENEPLNEEAADSGESVNLIHSSNVPNIVEQKIDRTVSNEYNSPRSDPEHFEQVESVEVPSMDNKVSRSIIPGQFIRDIPEFVGNIIEEIQSNYEEAIPERTRSQDKYQYQQHMEPIYSQIPRSMYYGYKFNNLPYDMPYGNYEQPSQRRMQSFGDERGRPNFQPNNEFNRYQSRRLKMVNETNISRDKRNIEMMLGMENEDDYTEDLNFKTETLTTVRIVEDEEESASGKFYVESIKLKTGSSTSSSSEDLHTLSTTSPLLVQVTTPSIKDSYHSSTMMTTTKISKNFSRKSRRKRAKRFRRIRRRKLLTRLRKKINPENTTPNVFPESIVEREPSSFSCSEKIEESTPETFRKRCAVYKKIGNEPTKNDRSTGCKDSSSHQTKDKCSLDYNEFIESLRVPRYQNTGAANERSCNPFFTSQRWRCDPSKIYKHMGYSRYRPHVPVRSCRNFWMNLPYNLHFPSNKVHRNQGEDFFKNRCLSPCRKTRYCSFNCRKLMANSNGSNHTHTISKRDIIDGVMNEDETSESIEKRTESDYGEEPDLSEGQNFKKHFKLKKYNKVIPPSKNFEDNYEYEEVPSGKTSFLGYKKSCSPKKHCKKKFKLKKAGTHSCHNSFRDRLARLKNKLFSSPTDETEKAIRDENPYKSEYEENKRSERQSEPTRLKNQDDWLLDLSRRSEFADNSDNRHQCCFDPFCSPPSNPNNPCLCPSDPCSWSPDPSRCPCDPCPCLPYQDPSQLLPDPCPCPCSCDPCPSDPPLSDPCSCDSISCPFSRPCEPYLYPLSDDPRPPSGVTYPSPCDPRPSPCNPSSYPYPSLCKIAADDEDPEIEESDVRVRCPSSCYDPFCSCICAPPCSSPSSPCPPDPCPRPCPCYPCLCPCVPCQYHCPNSCTFSDPCPCSSSCANNSSTKEDRDGQLENNLSDDHGIDERAYPTDYSDQHSTFKKREYINDDSHQINQRCFHFTTVPDSSNSCPCRCDPCRCPCSCSCPCPSHCDPYPCPSPCDACPCPCPCDPCTCPCPSPCPVPSPSPCFELGASFEDSSDGGTGAHGYCPCPSPCSYSSQCQCCSPCSCLTSEVDDSQTEVTRKRRANPTSTPSIILTSTNYENEVSEKSQLHQVIKRCSSTRDTSSQPCPASGPCPCPSPCPCPAQNPYPSLPKDRGDESDQYPNCPRPCPCPQPGPNPNPSPCPHRCPFSKTDQEDAINAESHRIIDRYSIPRCNPHSCLCPSPCPCPCPCPFSFLYSFPCPSSCSVDDEMSSEDMAQMHNIDERNISPQYGACCCSCPYPCPCLTMFLSDREKDDDMLDTKDHGDIESVSEADNVRSHQLASPCHPQSCDPRNASHSSQCSTNTSSCSCPCPSDPSPTPCPFYPCPCTWPCPYSPCPCPCPFPSPCGDIPCCCPDIVCAPCPCYDIQRPVPVLDSSPCPHPEKSNHSLVKRNSATLPFSDSKSDTQMFEAKAEKRYTPRDGESCPCSCPTPSPCPCPCPCAYPCRSPFRRRDSEELDAQTMKDLRLSFFDPCSSPCPCDPCPCPCPPSTPFPSPSPSSSASPFPCPSAPPSPSSSLPFPSHSTACPCNCSYPCDPCPSSCPYPCPNICPLLFRRQCQNLDDMIDHNVRERCVIGYLQIPSPGLCEPSGSCGSCVPCRSSDSCGACNLRETCGPNGPFCYSPVPCTINYGIPNPCTNLQKRNCQYPCSCPIYLPESFPCPEICCSIPELCSLPCSSHFPRFPVSCGVTYPIPCPCSYLGKRSNGLNQCISLGMSRPVTWYPQVFVCPHPQTQTYGVGSNANNQQDNQKNLESSKLAFESSRSELKQPSINKIAKNYEQNVRNTVDRFKRNYAFIHPSIANCPHPKQSRDSLDCCTPPYCYESISFNDPYTYCEPICQLPHYGCTCGSCNDRLCGYGSGSSCISCSDPDSVRSSNPCSDSDCPDPCPASEPSCQSSCRESNMPNSPRYWNSNMLGSCPCPCTCRQCRTPLERRSDALQPAVFLPTSADASDLIASLSSNDKYNDKEKRKCPKPCEPLPPSPASPLPYPLPCDDTTNDMLAEKVRRVNEFLKNKFLSGRYTMNNQLLPRNRRQLSSAKSTLGSRDSKTDSLVRQVRRAHGVPKKPSNKKMPQQNGDTNDARKNVKMDDNEIPADSLVKHNIHKKENSEVNDEETCPVAKGDRTDYNAPFEEPGRGELKPEDFMLIKQKSNSEYQDMHFAKELVEAIMSKVNKDTNLKVKIGNALNKKRIYETEVNQRNHEKICNFEERAEYEEAKNLLRSVSCVLNKLVKKQIEEKLCERLPTYLKTFLKRIVRPPKHRISQRHDDKYHEDTFLFRASCPPAKLDPDTRSQLEVNLVKLLDRYNQLDEDSRKRAAPIKSYIASHLDMLKKLEDDTSNMENAAEGPDNVLLEPNEQSRMETRSSRNEFDSRAVNNLDLMEKDLENLGQRRTAFQNPSFRANAFSPLKIAEEENMNEIKLKKRESGNENKQSLLDENEKSNKKRDNKGQKISEKYKKLVKAAEEVRFKRKMDEKIGEAFGDKKIHSDSANKNQEADQVAFDTPLVYRT